MSNLFVAQAAVKAQFEKDAKNKTYCVKFYTYKDGQILESESRPPGLAPGYKFECRKNGKGIECIDIT